MSTALFNPLLEQAIELSAQWHDNTFRKGSWRDPAFEVPPAELLGVPVMAHVTNVAVIVQRAGWDDITVAAAFLHDIIEDANQFGEELRYGELGTLMGREVADRVMEVTERKYDEHGNRRDWLARKEGYITNLSGASSEAVAISLADKLHNLWTMNETLERGVNIFKSEGKRKALGAGPKRQLWFHNAVLRASKRHSDARLVPMREALQEQIDRFKQLTTETPVDSNRHVL